MKAIVTTVPFGAFDPTPIKLLNEAGLAFTVNPLNRKLKNEEVSNVIGDADIVIAGTERLDEAVFKECGNLKAICRVGIGLDSVDQEAADRYGIRVSYTPDAPADAVAELTVGLMLDGLRNVTEADREIRRGVWQRRAGRRLALSKIGVIGVGRIGSRVIGHLLGGFPGVDILANDTEPNTGLDPRISWVDKETIYRTCDVITLHLPLTSKTKNLITADELRTFMPHAILINTARGGIVNETDLALCLGNRTLAGAAFDVFETEPYTGELCGKDNVILTCHLGSMTEDCRARMEIEATEEAIRFAKNESFLSPAPAPFL